MRLYGSARVLTNLHNCFSSSPSLLRLYGIRVTSNRRISFRNFTVIHLIVTRAFWDYWLNFTSRMSDFSQYVLSNETGICLLDCESAFNSLTDKEKLYSHFLSRASFHGGLIVLLQTSPESPGIFVLLQKLFRAQPVKELEKLALKKGLSPEQVKALFIYAAGFYSNMGNYKSFGDSKFIPNLPMEMFETVVLNSAAANEDPKGIKSLWESLKGPMYSLDERVKSLGLGPKGITTYFSSNCEQKDAKLAQEFLDKMGISPYNTRLFKTEAPGQQKPVYEVRLASVEKKAGPIPGLKDGIIGQHEFKPQNSEQTVTFNVTRGDYSELMTLVVEDLKKAKSYAFSDNEKKMLEEYITSFTTGSNPAHKDGSRYWIKNKGPIVETYIGFIESYRDPFGVRGEFEGFVAVVNKEMSAKFSELVKNAEHFLALLPWPAEYEKDTFLRPDFTSLDVLSFGGSGIPAGINIPNYDDIRQNEGFKNVSLGNVLTSGYKDTVITFLSEEDKELYQKLKIPSFEVQVGLHELLGHGSGKLFRKDENGKFNFDIQAVKHIETGEKVKTYYEGNETWDSKFSEIASSYEECRAECVGIYLCLSTDALKIFGHIHDDADDIIYVNWLNMARAGLLSLEFYTPEKRQWRQAHMQARFCILRVMLEAGDGLVTIKKVTGADGKPDLLLTLDRTKIIPVGKPAIGNFLKRLQLYKSTADFAAGKAMFDFYSDVNDKEEPRFASIRDIVLDRKQPRKMFVQHHTYQENGNIALKSYEAKPEGLIQSFVDRFPSTNIDDIIMDLWKKDQPFF